MKILKKFKYYILAFIIPLIICFSILYFKGVFNDVEEIMVSDLRIQHLSFLNYLKNVLLGKSSLFYSFYAGMGNSMLSTVIFYCTSPINLLLLLLNDIQYAIVWIYVIKVCLSGLTMFILLKSKRETDNKFITVMFSTSYAVSSFSVCYFFSFFWFDILYLAPLVTLGIDKMFKSEKINLLYIFSLSLAIICNIQMGFGLCLYSLIYYFYSYKIRYDIKKDIKKFKQFGFIFLVSSLCAGAISSGVLLIFNSEYKNIFTTREGLVDMGSNVSNIGYILKNLFSVGNLKLDYYNNYEPFIYSGLCVSFFSILYFFNKDIDKKKRICSLGVVLIFLISFCISFINVFWHLFSPVLLNFRYSIYLSLFLVIMAYECYTTKNKLNSSDVSILVILLFVGFLMILIFPNDIYVSYTALFLILIFTFILLIKNKYKKLEIIFCFLVFFEIFMNGYLSIYTASDFSFVRYGSYDNLLELSSKNEFEDGYRVMYNYSYTDYVNDSLLLNKNSSLRFFSSVINGNVVNFFGRNSIGKGINTYFVSAYDSPLLLSLFGNKYFYLKEELYNTIYNKVSEYKINNVYDYTTGDDSDLNVYLYENPYALSLGYVVDSDVLFKEDMNLVDYQNAIIKGFTGSDNDVLINLDYYVKEDSEVCNSRNFYDCKTYIINNNSGNLNMYVYGLYDEFVVGNKNARVYMDNGDSFMISSIDKEILLTLGYSSKLYDENLIVTTYDHSNLINNLVYLQQDMLENIKIDKNILKASIDSSKSGILFLSIPYDDNFKIYVDNKQVSYYPMLDNSFIGLDIEEGIHDIVIEYIDDNFKWYILCSVVSIFITLILYFYVNKRISRRIIEERLILGQYEEKSKEKKKSKNKKKR